MKNLTIYRCKFEEKLKEEEIYVKDYINPYKIPISY